MSDSPLRTPIDQAERHREAVAVADRILSQMATPQSPRPEDFPPFRTADGRRWTHTRERGWVRSDHVEELAEPPTHREAHEEEPSVEARRVLTPREEMNRVLDEEARQIAEEAGIAQGRRNLEMMQLRREYTEEWPATAAGRLRLRNRIRQLLRETVDAHVLRQQREGYDIEFDPVWQAAHRAVCEWDGLPSNFAVTRLSDMIARWNGDQASAGRAFYTDDSNEASEQEGGDMPPALQAYSESSSSESEPEAGADVEVRVGRMTRARRSLVFPANRPGRLLSQHQTQVRQQLRVLQECLDAEMAVASDGTAFSEGSYLSMMNAVKAIWQTIDEAFVL